MKRVSRFSSSGSYKHSYSKTSSSADAFVEVVPESLSFEELEQAVALLTQANNFMSLENEVFERTLLREDPHLLTGMAAILDAAAAAAGDAPVSKMATSDSVTSGSGSPSHSNPSHVTTESPTSRSLDRSSVRPPPTPDVARCPSRLTTTSSDLSSFRKKTSSLDRCPKMSMSQRADLVHQATDEIKVRAQTAREHSKHAAILLRAQTEEASTRLAETRSDRHQLEHEVCVAAADPNTGRVPGEKLQRFLTEWLRVIEVQVDRYRLKTSALRSHQRRVLVDLAQKKELGEALSPVDFDKIRIDLEMAQRDIKHKAQQLTNLKSVSGSATQRVMSNKKRLLELRQNMIKLRALSSKKRNQISELLEEERTVEQELHRAERSLNSLRLLMDKYTVPEVLEYVRMKQELDGLRRDVKVWERRTKVQLETERELRREVRALGMSPDPSNPSNPTLSQGISHENVVGSTSDSSAGPAPMRRQRSARPARQRTQRRRVHARTLMGSMSSSTSSICSSSSTTVSSSKTGTSVSTVADARHT